MKKIIIAILGLMFLGGTIKAATVLFPFQGGTGTGTVPKAGQILIGNASSTYTPAYLTAGTNITISTSSGAITITAAGGTGITSLNGQTDSSQTFATSADTNVGLKIVSSGGIHTLTSLWIGTLAYSRLPSTIASSSSPLSLFTGNLSFASTTGTITYDRLPADIASSLTALNTFSGTLNIASTTISNLRSGFVYVNGSGVISTTTVGVANLSSVDFGEFTCNGTACSVDSGAITLDEIGNPAADKTFTMGNNEVIFDFGGTNTTNNFELNVTGNSAGDLLHVHQHTGNPTGGHIAHFEWIDPDLGGVRITNNNSSTTFALWATGLINFNSNFYIDNTGSVATGTWKGTTIGYAYLPSSLASSTTPLNTFSGNLNAASSTGLFAYSQLPTSIASSTTALNTFSGTIAIASTTGAILYSNLPASIASSSTPIGTFTGTLAIASTTDSLALSSRVSGTLAIASTTGTVGYSQLPASIASSTTALSVFSGTLSIASTTGALNISTQSNILAGRSLSTSTAATIDIDTEIFTRSATANFQEATTSAAKRWKMFCPSSAATITEVSCGTNGGTINLGVFESLPATWNASTSNIVDNITCDSNSASSTSFSDAAIASGNCVTFYINSVAGATTTYVKAEYTIDD